MHRALQRLVTCWMYSVCCAHEYTEANLRWAKEQRPGDAAIQEHLQNGIQIRARGGLSLLSSSGLERRINLFLQADRALN